MPPKMPEAAIANIDLDKEADENDMNRNLDRCLSSQNRRCIFFYWMLYITKIIFESKIIKCDIYGI